MARPVAPSPSKFPRVVAGLACALAFAAGAGACAPVDEIPPEETADAGPADPGPCETDADCPFGHTCVDEVCIAQGATDVDDTGCFTHQDCPPHHRCALSTGACVPVADAPALPEPDDSVCEPEQTRECGSKVGACEYGVERCDAGQWSGVCEGGVVAHAELCNAIDDDCDYDADEDFTWTAPPGSAGAGEDDGAPLALGEACAVGTGACRREGVVQCTADESAAACSAAADPPDARGELCGDGLDNDCDGATDEGFAVGQACAVGLGACLREGVLQCSDDGLGVVCSAVAGPEGADELCGNGVDDDCDGAVDEGFEQRAAACLVGEAPCQVSGELACTPDALALFCDIPPADGETCNERDDDGDGCVDEDYATGGGCAVGVGACRTSGVMECNAGADGVVCGAAPADPDPAGERCGNGADDDCDGATDEGFDVGFNCSRGDGVCRRTGQKVCAPDGLATTCDAVPAAPITGELCGNSLDDDCDAQTDEGYDVGASCSVGVGICVRSGAKVCSADRLGTTCGATAGAPNATGELCGNGLDDDCDSATDEGYDVGASCTVGLGICARTGSKVCRADRLGTQCGVSAGLPNAAGEICGNGLDDDCDGQVDEGFDVGAACSAGDGVCTAGGTKVCAANGLSTVCSATPGAPNASGELCGNTLDDDCDRSVDEGYDVGAVCSAGTGICARSGAKVCRTDRLGTQCDAVAGPANASGELCGNSLDDDCDAQTDEGYDVGASCSVGTGICVRAGSKVCSSDRLSTQCGASAGPPNAAGELCGNSLDDDCDAQTDEGYDVGASCSVGTGICARTGAKVCTSNRLGTQCGATAGAPNASGELCGNTLDDDCDGSTDEGYDVGASCTVGLGICARTGAKVCTSNRLGTQCGVSAGAPNPGGEICGNGLDDDCDGQVDEGFDVGAACTSGQGICAASGTKMCRADGLATVCSAVAGSPNASGELCGNGQDDDCDGSTDEGYTTGTSCTAGTGVCGATGTRVCSADRLSTTCSATPGAPNPSGELCGNGLDDDCDAQTDEGYDVGATCAAGVGGCRRTGTKVCSADRLSTTCGATPGAPNPSGELCGNSIDDDCDSQTDEGYDVGTACSAGTGICARSGTKVCTSDRLATQCGATPGAPNASGELCGNGLDDDCDASTDEGYDVGAACTSGVGECERSGTKVCTSNRLATQCGATPGLPQAEACDDEDDDCNGTVDNGCDDDGDGYCDDQLAFTGTPDICPSSTNDTLLDCQDNNADVNPGELEICGDARDQNCDGENSDGCPSCRTNVDRDFDGSNECNDCDDTNGAVRPGAAERCNGADDDCDGAVDETFDVDRDTYTTCGTLPGGGLDPAYIDCDDTRSTRHPFACELCANASGTVACGASNDRGNSVDEDCDGYVDETCSPCSNTDPDGDGVSQCGGDCAPSDRTVRPGAPELCDGKDTDCNVFTTENCQVGDRCNWTGAPPPDTCAEELVCVESLGGGGQRTGNFTCTSLCNTSLPALGLGDGCDDGQTCAASLTPTGNIHGCAVTEEIGALELGADCTDGSQCRSGNCFRDMRYTGNVRYCTDACGSDDYCPSGSTSVPDTKCQIVGDKGMCLRIHSVQTRDLGAACSDTNVRCMAGPDSCITVPGSTTKQCTDVCCTNSDCPSTHYCSLNGNDSPGPAGGYDTAPICMPNPSGLGSRQAGAACTSSSQCDSNFCDVALGVCIDTCCNDSTCPTGLTCESALVTRADDHQTFARVCLGLSPSVALDAR